MIENEILIVSIILTVLIVIYLFSVRKIKLRSEKRGQVQTNRNNNTDRDESQEVILNDYGLKYLYHMTHKNNLDSILNNGLLSHNEMQNQNIEHIIIYDTNVIEIRANKRDSINNKFINDYAALYFNPRNPMLYKRLNIQNDIIIFGFDISLIYKNNSIFTDGNAASGPTSFYNNLMDLEKINWKCLKGKYWHDYKDGKRIKCAEVLVDSPIANIKIKKVFCNYIVTLDYVEQRITNCNHITAELKRNLFF